MKIVFLGTPDFSLPSLKAIAGSHHTVVGVVTQPDKERDRGKITFSPVKECALKLGLNVLQFDKIRTQGVQILKNLAPDIMVTCAYGQIISQEILDIAHYGVVNVHGSLLPKYRGSSPIQWAVINGETKTGITIMQTAIGIDSGDIMLQKEVDILPQETAGELFDRLSFLGAETIIEALDLIENDIIKKTKQNEAKATHFPMLKKEDGKIDWSMRSDEIVCRVRGFNPWPSAYSFLNGKLFKVWRAETASEQDIVSVMHAMQCGAGVIDKNRLFIKCGNGVVELLEVQLESKRRMTAREFLVGFNLEQSFCFN